MNVGEEYMKVGAFMRVKETRSSMHCAMSDMSSKLGGHPTTMWTELMLSVTPHPCPLQVHKNANKI